MRQLIANFSELFSASNFLCCTYSPRASSSIKKKAEVVIKIDDTVVRIALLHICLILYDFVNELSFHKNLCINTINSELLKSAQYFFNSAAYDTTTQGNFY